MKKVIVDVKGGLGNQLFCYSFGYAFAKQYNAELLLDVSMYNINNVKDRKFELDAFNVDYKRKIDCKYKKNVVFRKLGLNRIIKRFSIGLFTKIIREKKEYKYDAKIKFTKNAYFSGFWQCPLYFEKYRNDLLEMITPVFSLSESAKNLILEIKKKNSVSIHVRHGDYISLGWDIPMRYYDVALNTLCDKVKEKMSLVIFSDDVSYCKEHFKKYEDRFELIYPEYESDNFVVTDMYIMSKCKYNIMANSSYSWWAAWLNANKDKIVLCPEIGVWEGDFYPKEWIKIHINNG